MIAVACLSDEFRIQVQQTYSLAPNSGEATQLDRLAHLSDRERHTAQLLRDTLAHYLAGENDDKTHRIAALLYSATAYSDDRDAHD